jgi:hypothetical protein
VLLKRLEEDLGILRRPHTWAEQKAKLEAVSYVVVYSGQLSKHSAPDLPAKRKKGAKAEDRSLPVRQFVFDFAFSLSEGPITRANVVTALDAVAAKHYAKLVRECKVKSKTEIDAMTEQWKHHHFDYSNIRRHSRTGYRTRNCNIDYNVRRTRVNGGDEADVAKVFAASGGGESKTAANAARGGEEGSGSGPGVFGKKMGEQWRKLLSGTSNADQNKKRKFFAMAAAQSTSYDGAGWSGRKVPYNFFCEDFQMKKKKADTEEGAVGGGGGLIDNGTWSY